jgi:hypothetical protein
VQDQREHRQLGGHVSNVDEELKKLHTAVHYGADTVMDLSTGGDIPDDPRADSAALAGADRHGADLRGAGAGEAHRGPERRRVCSR